MPVFDCATGKMRAHTAGELAAIAAVPATPAQVVAERERRLAAGFDFHFADARGTHRIGTTKQDLEGWDEVSKWATAALARNTPTATIRIVTDTGPAIVTAIEWQDILLAATAFRQPIWEASFILQGTVPIPASFADDAHWPAVAQVDAGAHAFDLGGHA